jgi:hypothetical protein
MFTFATHIYNTEAVVVVSNSRRVYQSRPRRPFEVLVASMLGIIELSLQVLNLFKPVNYGTRLTNVITKNDRH